MDGIDQRLALAIGTLSSC